MRYSIATVGSNLCTEEQKCSYTAPVLVGVLEWSVGGVSRREYRVGYHRCRDRVAVGHVESLKSVIDVLGHGQCQCLALTITLNFHSQIPAEFSK
jgi:hypothetical protein